jgi:hypothetical protein
MHNAPKALKTPAVRVAFSVATTKPLSAFENILDRKIKFSFSAAKILIFHLSCLLN